MPIRVTERLGPIRPRAFLSGFAVCMLVLCILVGFSVAAIVLVGEKTIGSL